YFFAFALIEDSGYLPRLGFLLDRAFKKIGLSGRAIIPMVLGLGCVSMATMVTRTLPTRRERIIATLLLALCIPCAAQTGVIMGLLAVRPHVLAAWACIILSLFMAVGMLSAKILPGARPTFLIEIPPMRVPQMKNVLVKTGARVAWYFKEVVPLFALASALIWLGQVTGAFDLIVRIMSAPLAVMGLPPQAATAFLFGFFRRDYGAAGLYDLNQQGVFTGNQLLIAAVVLTLFLPCITQFIITIKERGWKIGIALSLFILLFSFCIGVILNGALIVTHLHL
ncbi:MAG: nucleoside recognition domain-containing protein, partial [bacterium]